MPDFANITNPLTLESIGIAAAAWAFFMILAPYMAQRTGVKFEEPPVWLYSRSFSAIRVLSLLVAAYLGALFPLGKDITAHLADLAIPFGLAAGFAVAVGLIIAGGVWMWRRMKARQEAVVLEPLTAGGILLRGLILIVIVGVFIGGPWTLREYAGVDIIGPLFGGEGGGSGYAADLGAFLGLLLTFVLFWVVPNIVADRLENMDISPIWASTSGLEFFRWNLLGLVLLLTTGVLGFTAALDPYFKRPVFWPICVAIPSAGAVIYIVFWALPMRSLGRLAAEGDYLAKDLLSRVRFSGASAWIVYKRRSHGRAKSLSGDDQKRLCPTCLRPIHDISLYKNLKFDHCPHCQSFMPPVFTMLDYVNHQSGRLMPLIEDQGPPGAITKKKKIRAEDEDRLVQDLLRALFALAVSERGTDLHFVVEGEKVAIRCRTDGVLYTMMQFEKVMAKPLISAVKVMANLDITERRKPQDGSFKIDVGERSIDVRINTSPVPEGEMASMRLLYAHSALGSLDKLEMGSRNTKLLTKLIHSPSGLILVTGPTGSGKSTTLYNALESIATGERNIVTLEDPIEHQIKGLSQMQVNNSKGFTFATGLRSILRQDPDVIMVGEIRDTETAKMAIDAAATGHLVFSTLHATDSVGAIGRFTDLEIDPKRMADVTMLVLAQRLVRINCPRCSREHIATREEIEQAGFPGAPKDRFAIRSGTGCDYCHQTGFYGREGIYEFFVPNDEIKHLISAGAPMHHIRSRARALGMRTLMENGIVKVLMGKTTIEELARVTN